MKFQVNSKDLYDKLLKCSKSVNSKSPLPILSCFLFGIKNNKLYLVADDTEVRITTSVDLLQVEGEGSIAIESYLLLDSLKELPEQPITFDVDPQTFQINISYNNGAGEYNYMGKDGSEFPQPKNLSENTKQKIIIPSHDLQNLLQGTLFAMGSDELRPIMSGVFFDITKDDMTFVATDASILVRLKSNLKGSERGSFVLPKKPANLIKGLLSKESDDVIINFDLTHAIFKIGDFSVTSRFIEGNYPNYNSVIPIGHPNKIELNRDVIVGMLSRVSTMRDKVSDLIAFDIDNNSLTISARNLDFSLDAKESTEIIYNGTPLKIGFKASLLLELLKNMSSSDIIMAFEDHSKPALFTPVFENASYNQTGLITTLSLD